MILQCTVVFNRQNAQNAVCALCSPRYWTVVINNYYDSR
nr:MAG TPA: hypothetical protein [Caudoviricetes sp.]